MLADVQFEFDVGERFSLRAFLPTNDAATRKARRPANVFLQRKKIFDA